MIECRRYFPFVGTCSHSSFTRVVNSCIIGSEIDLAASRLLASQDRVVANHRPFFDREVSTVQFMFLLLLSQPVSYLSLHVACSLLATSRNCSFQNPLAFHLANPLYFYKIDTLVGYGTQEKTND